MKAFPIKRKGIVDGKEKEVWQDGMDLRDYFAAKAMQAIISNPTGNFSLGPIEPNDNKTVSIAAYKIADAMMEARNDS